MKKFSLANSKSLQESNVVLVGVPTDLAATSKRKGRVKAPDKIREVSGFLYAPEKGKIRDKIYDMGNLRQSSRDIFKNLEEIADVIHKLTNAKKKVVVIGGDCSIKHGICRGLNRLNKKIGIIHFDAHPDFVESKKPYYGSALADNIKLENVDPKSCIVLGIRNAEDRELGPMKKKKVKFLTALDIKEIGLDKTVQEIKKTVSKADIVQLSIDVDVVDPAFTPGVGVPCPGGLSSSDLLYLIKKLNKLKIVVVDLTEVIPEFDSSNVTAQLCCRIIQEFLAK